MSDFRLGQHEEAIRTLQASVTILDEKMDRLVAFTNRIDGAWKSATMILAGVSAFVSFLVSIVVEKFKSHG